MNKLFYKWEKVEVIPEYTRTENEQISLYNYIRNSSDEIKDKIHITIKNTKWEISRILLNDHEINIMKVHEPIKFK